MNIDWIKEQNLLRMRGKAYSCYSYSEIVEDFKSAGYKIAAIVNSRIFRYFLIQDDKGDFYDVGYQYNSGFDCGITCGYRPRFWGKYEQLFNGDNVYFGKLILLETV